MKASEVYREAAQRIEKFEEKYSCQAIRYAGTEEHVQAYVDLMRVPAGMAGWADKGASEETRLQVGYYVAAIENGENIDGVSCRDMRVLALCFMAAIAEDEEMRRNASSRRKRNGGRAK